jgi:hypothetical protein
MTGRTYLFGICIRHKALDLLLLAAAMSSSYEPSNGHVHVHAVPCPACSRSAVHTITGLSARAALSEEISEAAALPTEAANRQANDGVE